MEIKMTSEAKANYVNESEFNQLLGEQKLVVADYTASWCGPCKMVAPLMDKLATNYGDRATVVKIDIDENKDNAKKYGIRSIPAVLIFRDGELVESLFGSKPYETYSESIETQLKL
jgi:thioredoxin 1